MTVIAWDGETLAADKQATACGFATVVTKIHRVAGGIVGMAGNAGYCVHLVDWFNKGADPQAWPKAPPGEEGADALFISDDGEIRVYASNGNGYADVKESRFVAMGCGRDYALAAMHLGRTAKEAVQVACDLDVFCGQGIDTLTLGDKCNSV